MVNKILENKLVILVDLGVEKKTVQDSKIACWLDHMSIWLLNKQVIPIR